MVIALNFTGHASGDAVFCAVALFSPVTDAGFGTGSETPSPESISGMRRFRGHCVRNEAGRTGITASPLRDTCEQPAFFPPTRVITTEADVLRDEREVFAAGLREAMSALS